MLPGHVAGFYSFEACHIDLRHLAEFAGAQFYLDRAVGLDLTQGRVLCDRRPPGGYDWLSVDIGSIPDPQQIPGIDYTIPIKPVHLFLTHWQYFLQEIEAQPQHPWHCAIVGGGAGGVELILALQARVQRLAHRLQQKLQPELKVQFHLIQGGSSLMSDHALSVQHTFQQCLQQRAIKVHLNQRVIAVEASPPRYRLKTSAGLNLPCDRIFWTTQATAPDWIAAAGLTTDDRGFIVVTDTLQSCSHPQIFAAGDIATMQNHPRPKAGVFAVRQGKPLYQNLRRVLEGKSPRPFVPQRDILALIGDGQGQAAASRGTWGLPLSTGLWHWKDHIDRRFIAKFQNLPPQMQIMASPTPASATLLSAATPTSRPMYCTGCGSKVGHSVLTHTLQRLRQEGRLRSESLDSLEKAWESSDILVGVGQADDAAVIESRSDQFLVQTVDFFTSPFSDPFVAGQIITEHCLNDLYALGSTPHSALAIVTLPHGQPHPQEETLYQLLAGVAERLQAVGAYLLGGQTIEGEGLALGLSCNGWVKRSDLWHKGQIRAGQALILTKALGTGTLFVAQKKGKAKAAWLDAAIDSMGLSHHRAIPVLRQYGVTACTDVTGFGLWGHTLELLRWTTAKISLDLDALPLLPGALESLADGHFSSLYPQNLKYQSSNTNDRLVLVSTTTENLANHPHWPVLFDPQTAGGLLAAVPQTEAEQCLQELRQAGYPQSTIVGRVI